METGVFLVLGLGAHSLASGLEMELRLWIDDVRPAPEWATHVAKTPTEAVGHLEAAVDAGEAIEHVAFDHDLGADMGVVLDVRAVVRWMEWHDIYPESASIHTSNPAGRKWLEAGLKDHTKIVDTYRVT